MDRRDDMRKSIFEEARIRAEEKQNGEGNNVNTNGNNDPVRGRTLRNLTVMNFRPGNIEKNIVRDEHSRSRNPSIGSNRTRSITRLSADAGSNSSSVNSNKTAIGGNTANQNASKLNDRPNRYRHPLSTYSNDAVEAIVPHHSTMLFQKFQRTQDPNSTRSSKTNVTIGSRDNGSKSTQRTSISVSMDNEMIPAFNDLKMDLCDEEETELDTDDEQVSNDHDSYLSQMSTENDNKFSESLEMLKVLERQKNRFQPEEMKQPKVIREEQEEQVLPFPPQSSESNQSKVTIGRIQQKINTLKMLEREGKSTNQVFSSIEQKVLIESLKKELYNLRRYNYKPIIEAIHRVSERYNQIAPPKKDVSNRPYNFIMNKEIMITPFKQPETTTSRDPVNRKRLNTLIKTSSSIIDELWEEPAVYSGNSVRFRNNIRPSPSTDSLLPETRFLKEQLENFKYGTKSTDNLSISFEQSPKTSRV